MTWRAVNPCQQAIAGRQLIYSGGVRAGLLVGVHTGSCDVSATLAIDDIDVASKQAHLDLPGEIALKRERRLLPTRDYPPSENMATAADDVKA